MKNYKTEAGYEAVFNKYHQCYFIRSPKDDTMGDTFKVNDDLFYRGITHLLTLTDLRNITELIEQIQNDNK